MAMTKENVVRRVIFSPYRKGCGPKFKLVVWDTYRTTYGKSELGYRLTMYGGPEENFCNNVLFEGDDFGSSPLHAIDSDQTVAGIMGFLTLRPGDTDREYFKDYTPEQLDYCANHAEALACEVERRFGIG
jgi:hypothetical protein